MDTEKINDYIQYEPSSELYKKYLELEKIIDAIIEKNKENTSPTK